ncbi:MAG: hypothetical protein HQ582_15420, partial [Planctomycetes bacterium]|nr:hypothetical protein [Planctomycetota bacterium]
DEAIREKKVEISAVKREALREISRIKRAQRPQIQKVAEIVPEALNASRAILTSFDLSAVLRQGGVLSAAHPVLSKDAIEPMLRAFASEHGQETATVMISELPTAELAQQAGLEITTDEASLEAMEEAYMSRLAGKIPGVSHSARAYMTFLNVQRATVFDALVEKLGRGGEVTLDEAKVLANWVNVASGRGNMGRAQGAAAALATVFFAPRYVLSRFQLILGQPLLTGMLKGQRAGRARYMIAQEYVRMATGYALFYGTFAMAAALLWDPDDEDKPTLTFDWRSADFGKLKFGETRIDPLAGHAQAMTLLGRLRSGETVNAQGKVTPLMGEERKYGGPSIAGTLGRFTRSKLSPAVGTGVDVLARENVVGEKVTPASGALDLVTPLIWEDVTEAMEAQGVAKGTAIGILAILGMSSQTYGERTEYQRAKPLDRKELFESFLVGMEWNSAQPAYHELLTEKQREQVDERRDEVRRGLVFRATEAMPIRAKEKSDKTYEQATKRWETTQEEFREMAKEVPYEQAVDLLKWDYAYQAGMRDENSAVEKALKRGATPPQKTGVKARVSTFVGDKRKRVLKEEADILPDDVPLGHQKAPSYKARRAALGKLYGKP